MAESKYTVVVDFSDGLLYVQGKLLKDDQLIESMGGPVEVVKPQATDVNGVTSYERFFVDKLKGRFLKEVIGDRVRWTRSGTIYLEKSPEEKLIEQFKEVMKL